MALSIETICKNTFISFVAEPLDADDDTVTSSLVPHRLPPRSRSAECARCRPEADELQQLTQQSLHRLNSVLSGGVSLSEKLPLNLVPVHSICASPQQKPLGKTRRIDSNCSLSTMAPDDSSDCGDLPNPSNTKKMGLGMRHVLSSGSVSSMLSMRSWADMCEDEPQDGQEVVFELDIEAGAAAALEATSDKKQPAEGRLAEAAAPIGAAPDAAAMCLTVGKTTPEMSHNQVPRNQDMTEISKASRDEPPTTMMIRNIPGRYGQNDLMLDLKELGFEGTYDFLYMPMDKGTSANVGYAFVNFLEPSSAARSLQAFENFRFSRHQRASKKIAKVSVAHLQGLEKNLAHYEKAAVNMSKEKRRRPVVMASLASKIFG